MNAPQSLPALIDQAMTVRGAPSGRRLAELAQRQGFAVSHATINAIRSSSYKSRPTDDTVRAIAWLAGVDDEVAFRAAGLRVPGPPLAEELPPGVDNLSPEARRAVIGILRVLVQHEEVIGDAQQAAPMNEVLPRVTAIAAGVNDAGGTAAHAGVLIEALLRNGGLEVPPADLRTTAAGLTTALTEDPAKDAERVADALTRGDVDLAARHGTPGNPPDTTTGEENQDAGGQA